MEQLKAILGSHILDNSLEGAVVRGGIDFTAGVEDANGVKSVEIFVDGMEHPSDTDNTIFILTSSHSNAAHTILVRVVDNAGNRCRTADKRDVSKSVVA